MTTPEGRPEIYDGEKWVPFPEAVVRFTEAEAERDAVILRYFARSAGFKARIQRLRDIVTELASSEPCELDARGWCTRHSWYSRLPCPHGEARQILAAPDWDTSTIHHTSCPEHTGFKVCYCDCPTCRPDGVCACTHCGETHPGHTTA